MPARLPDEPERFPTLGLLARVVAVLLVGSFAALAFSSVALRANGPAWLDRAVDLSGAAGIGMFSGFAARLVTGRYKDGTRVLAAMTAVFCGLVTFGWMTDWHAGIRPPRFFAESIDWRGLGLLALGWTFALLTGIALRGNRVTSGERPRARAPARAAASRTGRAATTPRAQTRTSRPATKKAPAAKRKSPTRSSSSKTTSKKTGKTKSKAAPKTPARRAATPKAPPAVKTSSSAARKTSRRRKIVLAAEEEHRCPYCLELVKPNDPRGVVECEICHTLHHADCWAITGTCQVPHYNH